MLYVQSTYNASRLAAYPPVGAKDAICYQDSADAAMPSAPPTVFR